LVNGLEVASQDIRFADKQTNGEEYFDYEDDDKKSVIKKWDKDFERYGTFLKRGVEQNNKNDPDETDFSKNYMVKMTSNRWKNKDWLKDANAKNHHDLF
jgi:hypothetical protein